MGSISMTRINTFTTATRKHLFYLLPPSSLARVAQSSLPQEVSAESDFSRFFRGQTKANQQISAEDGEIFENNLMFFFFLLLYLALKGDCFCLAICTILVLTIAT